MKKIKISKKVKKILNKNRRRKFIEEIRKDTKERICKNALSVVDGIYKCVFTIAIIFMIVVLLSFMPIDCFKSGAEFFSFIRQFKW